MYKTSTISLPTKFLHFAILGVSALSISVVLPGAAVAADDDSRSHGIVERVQRDLDARRDSDKAKPKRPNQTRDQQPAAAAPVNRLQPPAPGVRSAASQPVARPSGGSRGGPVSASAAGQPAQPAANAQPVAAAQTAQAAQAAPPSLSVADAPPPSGNAGVLGALGRKAGSFFAYGSRGFNPEATLLLYLLAGGLAAGGLVLATGQGGRIRQVATLPQGLRQKVALR